MKYLKKTIRNGQMIPPWYGIAYVRLEIDEAVILPIPLNVVVGLWVRIHRFFKHGPNAYL